MLHPDLVPWELNREKSSDAEACYVIDGVERMNGGGHGHYKSREILSGNEICYEGDTVRSVFDGEYSKPDTLPEEGKQPDAVVVSGGITDTHVNGIPNEELF